MHLDYSSRKKAIHPPLYVRALEPQNELVRPHPVGILSGTHSREAYSERDVSANHKQRLSGDKGAVPLSGRDSHRTTAQS